MTWLTCSSLHNWLLDVDGMDNAWVKGMHVSDWQGRAGELDTADLPMAVRNLHSSNPILDRHYDLSGMGRGNDVPLRKILMKLM